MTSPTVRGFFGVLGWMLLVPCAMAALGAAWLLAAALHLTGDTRTAPGRVVAHHEVSVGPSHRKAPARHSIVEFVASDGRTLRFTDSVARQLQAVHRIGEGVTVRYSAANPLQAEISSSATLKVFIGAVLLLFSAIGMAAGWLGPVHTIFVRCVATQKGQAPGAKRSWGAAPARLGNAANGPFGSQPEGNGVKTAPLVVALLAKAPALASSRASIGAVFTPFALAKIV